MRRKHLHELKLQEQSELLNAIAKKIAQQNWDNGLYNIYQHSTDKKLLVHDYSDKQEIVFVNAETGNTDIIETIIK
ncbi:hypothetical protein ACFS5N_06030 [Mucilaginibacter ximonensis]|uniref:PepSY domain-containing protein n=1 Tax=Mucilaginibacter ximonensis TaxID=538021 RepID=A0ABW5Y9U1_9SPHI